MYALSTIKMAEITTNIAAWLLDILFTHRALPLVRGFFASIAASAILLKPIAAERAPAKASVTHTNLSGVKL